MVCMNRVIEKVIFDKESMDQKKTGTLKQIQELVFIILIAGVIRTFVFGLYQVPTGSMETTMLVGERFLADKLTPWFSKPKHGDVIAFNDPKFNYADNIVTRLFQMYVWGPMNWTKRVIGIPGDHVQGRIEDDKPVVYVNGVKLNEPYLNKYPLIHVDNATLRSYDPSTSYEQQPFYRMNEREVRAIKRRLELMGGATMLLPGTPLPPESQGSDVFDVTLRDNEYWVMGDNRLGSYDSRAWGTLPGHLIHARILCCLFSLDSAESWLILDLLQNPLEIWSRVRRSRSLRCIA